MRRLIKKRGQVWVETVIYTLIGLAIIGLVLAVAKPNIDRKKSEMVIEQSIESITNIDSKIYEVLSAQGNQRVVELKISEGDFYIDSENNKISWIIKSKFQYSEKDTEIPLGTFIVTTTGDEKNDLWEVKIEKEYSNLDLRFNNENSEKKQISPTPTPYKMTITNDDKDAESEGKTIVNIGIN
jgi:type II secretory pathway pseudopilin PulG